LLAIAALAEPWPLAFIVDTVLADKRPPGWITAIVGDGRGAMILLAVGLSLVITLLNGGLTVINEYITTKVDQRMVLDFRSDLFRRAQQLSLAYHDDTRTGMLMYRINNQADSVGQILVALPALGQSLLTLIGMLWVAYRIDPLLSFLAVAIVPFIYFSTTYYSNRIEPQLLRVRGLEGQNLSIVHEAMAMMRVVVSFGRERHEFERFRRQGEEAVDARIKLTVRQTAFQLVVSLITALGTATVLGVGAFRVLNDQISAGELLVVMAYIAAVYAPLETLTNSITSFQQQFISFDHALQLLDTPVDVQEKPDARPLMFPRGELDFDSVSFSYRSRPGTLKDISFSIKAGEAVALVGPTGAGKSTLVSLLPRLYDPERGRVMIDGLDVKGLRLESLRAQFSIVLQEPLLFTGTIGENIAYGKPGCTQYDIEEAAKAANAHEFIMRLPQKYDTPLGERGAKISGGERQRISVARAFLRDAPILILDEPTSSIDSRTEAVILEALERLMRGRTTIMIAHRLSTIRSVDRILVLHEGQLIQQGTHKSLMARPGLYRQLWQAQTRHQKQVEAAREALGKNKPANLLEPSPPPPQLKATNGSVNGSEPRQAATKRKAANGSADESKPRAAATRGKATNGSANGSEPRQAATKPKAANGSAKGPSPRRGTATAKAVDGSVNGSATGVGRRRRVGETKAVTGSSNGSANGDQRQAQTTKRRQRTSALPRDRA
jgi:ATP-binding cassette subfamily B protein